MILSVAAHYVLFDAHALWGPPTNMVSNTVEGNLQTVVYDLSKPSPWTMHKMCIQISFGVFVLSFLIVSRSFRTVAYVLWGSAWFAWQTWDEWKVANRREPGKYEWVFLLVFLVLFTLIVYVHERRGDHGGLPRRG